MTDLNDKTALVRRRIELAQADPPALFVLAPGAAAEDLDAALRIISSLRENVGDGLAPPASLPK